MSLDHGILNVSIDKRGGGSIDAQLDRYNAEQARAARASQKAKSQETKTERAEAKALVAKVSDAQLKRLAAKSGITVAAARKKLASTAHWQPSLVIAALA